MSKITIPENRPFEGFGKIARTSKGMACVITEKIDGTNAQIVIENNEIVAVGSRKRWITTGKSNDNFGFAQWVEDNYDELLKLGDGTHFGEWYGSGIQRGYGLKGGDKRFALFNTDKWVTQAPPECCEVVPVLWRGEFSMKSLQEAMSELRGIGSYAVPNYLSPEGVVAYLYSTRSFIKATYEFPDGKWNTA